MEAGIARSMQSILLILLLLLLSLFLILILILILISARMPSFSPAPSFPFAGPFLS
jgi:hypothetical protein